MGDGLWVMGYELKVGRCKVRKGRDREIAPTGRRIG